MNRVTSFILAVFLSASAALLPAAESPTKPNFLIVLADDLGFSDIGCYGGEIATPNLDRLAANGLRFSQFYNTARCWPTRSCLMTGYYAQQIRMDPTTAQTRLPAWTRVLPHYLKPAGYRCYHSGKWHVTAAPKPVADGGFNRSYWSQDWDRYFSPAQHFENDDLAPPVKPDSGYYATTAMADYAIKCLKEHGEKFPNQPFFQYLAFFAPHFPLHALPEDIARYRDRYLAGWDVVREQRWKRLKDLGIVHCEMATLDQTLSPRYFKTNLFEQVGQGESRYAVPWNSLTPEQQRFQATKMAIHAAMVDRMDREIGRVLEQVHAMGAWENTVILFLSDNGADATLMVRGDGHDRAADPGSWKTFLCLGPGWASNSNTPFRRHKVWVSEGGISTPLIVHWPKGISARGELRQNVGHVIDVVPTFLELAGVQPGETWNGTEAPPLPGKSLVPVFARDNSVKRDYLFFNHEGNRSLRMGDWKLVSAREDGNAWELFDLSRDRGERVNLASQQPERVRQMAAQWQAAEDQFRKQAGGNPLSSPR
jgi:arylsulfatase